MSMPLVRSPGAKRVIVLPSVGQRHTMGPVLSLSSSVFGGPLGTLRGAGVGAGICAIAALGGGVRRNRCPGEIAYGGANRFHAARSATGNPVSPPIPYSVSPLATIRKSSLAGANLREPSGGNSLIF